MSAALVISITAVAVSLTTPFILAWANRRRELRNAWAIVDRCERANPGFRAFIARDPKLRRFA